MSKLLMNEKVMYAPVIKDPVPAPASEKSDFAYSFLPGLLFVGLMWLIHFMAYLTDANLAWLGVRPRSFFGLIGVVLSPLLHGDLLHLLSNTFPVVLLSGFILYLHRNVAFRVLVLVYVGSGLLTWLLGRPSYHIGASGVVYGMAGFLLFNGFLRQNRSAMAVSFAVLFLYSGLFYGLFPSEERVSWEGHVAGFVAGLVATFVFGEKAEVGEVKQNVTFKHQAVQRHLSHTLGKHHQYYFISYSVKGPPVTGKISHTYTLTPETDSLLKPTFEPGSSSG